MSAFKCGDDSENKLNGINKPQIKNNKFEERKKCLDGNDYQKKFDNYLIRSLNHDMCLQKVIKNTLSPFDDKRCYESNFENEPWG